MFVCKGAASASVLAMEAFAADLSKKESEEPETAEPASRCFVVLVLLFVCSAVSMIEQLLRVGGSWMTTTM